MEKERKKLVNLFFAYKQKVPCANFVEIFSPFRNINKIPHKRSLPYNTFLIFTSFFFLSINSFNVHFH